jgi:hypothetical protein
VEQVAKKSQIPIESLPDELNQPIHPGSQVIFSCAGDVFDSIAGNYANVEWWVSDAGLNMVTVIPTSPPYIATFDEMMRDMHGAPISAVPRIKRRNKAYESIDEALNAIAESQPRTQGEVFRELESRVRAIPRAKPFVLARGWIKGFQKDPVRARSWLSKRWKELNLPPLPRGPKNPKQ